MAIHRKIVKRTRTIERISVMPDRPFVLSENVQGQKFRIEVFNEQSEQIYVCEFTGKIEIKELPNGGFHISGGNIR